jgi:DNA (cytosine-5)-methyltransferase 1
LTKAIDRPVGVDLFAGAGGMSLGFEQAGFDVLAAFDNDPVHVAVHRYNSPQTEAPCVDVSALRADEVAAAVERGWKRSQRAGSWNGQIDCLFGGPSCQGYSEIGRMHLADPRNDLVFEFARLVRELKPRYFVMENVPGLISPRYQPLVKLLCQQFFDAGYTLLDGGPIRLDASEYGVPQVRKRVFFIGSYRGEPEPAKPLPALESPTVWDALSDLPNADDFEELLDSETMNLPLAIRRRYRQVDGYLARMHPLPGASVLDPAFFGYERAWDPTLLTNSGRTTHTATVRRRLAALKPGEVEPISRLRRLDANKKSTTLRAGTGRDHGSFTASRPVHYEHPRVITIREAARLHSFPDWYRFHATKWHGFRQVGNAVPPALAQAVAGTIVQAVGLRPNRPRRVLDLGNPRILSLSLTAAADHVGFDPALLPYDVRRRASH